MLEKQPVVKSIDKTAKTPKFETRIVKGKQWRVNTKTGKMTRIRPSIFSYIRRGFRPQFGQVDSSVVFPAIKVFFLVVLLFSLIRFLHGAEQMTFKSFLDMIAGAPVISTDWIKFFDFNLSFPSPFNWFSNFLNMFGDVLSFSSFICISLANCVLYLIYFLRYLFL